MNWLPILCIGAGLIMCVIIFERRHTADYVKKIVEFLAAKNVEWD